MEEGELWVGKKGERTNFKGLVVASAGFFSKKGKREEQLSHNSGNLGQWGSETMGSEGKGRGGTGRVRREEGEGREGKERVVEGEGREGGGEGKILSTYLRPNRVRSPFL